ncbi:hypothetical protein ACFQY4_27070 [Catellatospora bangladeshensis]|uniref:SH3 domain-containing protein n=1 Tax=Catellatospora bangladeshensis TaxID=310355 RepID=A0A8J3NLL4_9ACTN|nr:hypothetical protein [Catellatospora bangladeshensis]GIF82655.1 hypothetical protein Cba03nite_40040 [Catellatospora bangladeshensis]
MRVTKMSMARAAVAVATAAAMFVVSPVPAAQAADNCNEYSSFPNGEGAGTMEVTANLKVGPYSSCGTVRSLAVGTRVFKHCEVMNSYGNIWWYVRVSGTSTYGWMSLQNLTNISGDDNGDGMNVTYACL